MKTTTLEEDGVKSAVRERYGKCATRHGGCGCAPTCRSPETAALENAGHDPTAISRGLGCSAADTEAVPEGANLGLGCGNPQALAALKPGETVLDLRSGAGFDAFLAARAEIPAELRKDRELYTGCVAGASTMAEIKSWLAQAGFAQIGVEPKDGSRKIIGQRFPGQRVEEFVSSATIAAVKFPSPGRSPGCNVDATN